MIRKILLTIALLVMMSVSSIGQTLLVNGAINPSQIPDVNGYRMVLIYLADNTNTTFAQKVAAVQFANSTDATALQTEVANFSSSYNGQTTDTASANTLTQSSISSIQANLSTTGAVQFNAFVQQQKTRMSVYSFTTDTSKSIVTYGAVTAFEFGDPDSGYDTGGYEDGYVELGPYTCNAYPQQPSSTYDSTTTEGTVRGLSGSVAASEANQAKVPPSINGQPGSGIVVSTVFNFYFLVEGNVCSRQIVDIKENLQYEIAYTKVLRTGGATNCSGSAPQVCSYEGSPWCANTATPDFHPTGVYDSYPWAAWYASGLCARIVPYGAAPGPWVCEAALAVGTSNTVKAGAPYGGPGCTYNP